MQNLRNLIGALVVAGGAVCSPWTSLGLAQVSPAEIRDPQLKAAEQTYSKQLLEISRSIARIHFPFPFVLNRYVGLDPKQQVDVDTRGLEFVKFHNRVTLKVSGNYNAAFNADSLTANQRANRVLDDVVTPMLRLVTDSFPADAGFEAYGFEISWHVRRRTQNYDYEGKEIIAWVLDKAAALSYSAAQRESERQEILGRSEILLNGKEFGLALGERDPLPVGEAEHVASQTPAPDSETKSLPPASNSDIRLARIYEDPAAGLRKPESKVSGGPASPSPDPDHSADKPQAVDARLTPADAEALQNNYRAELDALAKEGVSRFHFVDYAPPSFAVFRNRIHLQLTMRNSNVFDKNTTSIYKRAAQSFDVFLAPLLNPLLDKVPKSPEIAGLDITVLNQFNSKSTPSSEALEFICPLSSLRQFGEAEITSQDLINQSIVLVNGVRIGLDLQQVE